MTPARLQAAKVWCGGLGLVVGLAGMALERREMVYAAVVLLGAAVVIRLVARKRQAVPD